MSYIYTYMSFFYKALFIFTVICYFLYFDKKILLFLFIYFQLAEMVNLHFLSLIEALQEINSIVLANVCYLYN
jgi:hypothetical protein